MVADIKENVFKITIEQCISVWCLCLSEVNDSYDIKNGREY
jgi:hypothetical protein